MNRDFKIESKDGKKYINRRYCTPCEKFLTYYDVSEDNKCPHCRRDTYLAKSEVTEDFSKKTFTEYLEEEKTMIKELNVTLGLDKDRLLNDVIERLTEELNSFIYNVNMNDYIIHINK